MESLLEEVNAVIGVTGSFLSDGKGRTLARALPSVYDDATLQVVGRTMMQTFGGLESARRRKVGDIDMVFREGRLIVKPLGEACLGILCVPRMNVSLLNLTANVAVRKIQDQLKQAAAKAEPAPKAAPREAATAPAAILAPYTPRMEAAVALVTAARAQKIVLRVMGDTAVRLRCPTAKDIEASPDDEIIELAARGRQSGDVERLFKERGITPDARFNMLHASERLRFVDPKSKLPIEVFLNAFESFHRLDFAERLSLDEVTLPLADVLLSGLQLVQSVDRDQQRILVLLADHDLGGGEADIDPARIAEVCADDWGWYRTVTMNLEKAIAAAPHFLHGDAPATVEKRVRRLLQRIEEAPKSLGWQVRARMGDRRPWYTVPE